MPDTTSPASNMDERKLVRMIGAQASQPAHRRWRCPSAEKVAAYLDQSLGAKDKARFEAHVAGCDFCMGLVSSLARRQGDEERVEVPAHLLRKAIEAVPEKASAGRSWRWVLAPALATIVVGSAVLLKSPQPARFAPPEVSTPAVPGTSPLASAPAAKRESRSTKPPEVRSLKTPTRALQLLEPRSGSIVPGERLRFRWRAVATASYYEVRVVNSEGDPVWRAESTEPNAKVPADLSLQPGKYFVWVRAYLSNGRTLKSETIAFRIGSSS
jgi:putative zinc finger protein